MNKTLLSAMAFACLLTACNSNNNSNNASQNQDTMVEETQIQMPTIEQLKGSWRLTKVGDLNVGFETQLSFGENEEGVFGAKVVNSIFGKYLQIERRADAVRFQDMGSTKMMGPDDEMKVEDTLIALLDKVRSFRVEGDVLNLIDEDTNVLIQAKKN